jgi:hypothetical protein
MARRNQNNICIFSFSVILESWNLHFYGTGSTKDFPTTTIKTSNTITTTTFTPYSNIDNGTSRSKSGSLSVVGVAGIVVGIMAAVILTVVCVIKLVSRCRNRGSMASTTNSRTGVFVISIGSSEE